MLSKQLNQGGIAFAPRALLLATTALTSVLAIGPAGAQPLPTGGSVAAGSVSIGNPSATQLNITQTSQSAVVNWQSFSIGQGNSVNILQPNSSSALLNRVTGAAPSTIAGSLTANGQIYLVNPNGITITKYAVVNTGGGFVASTLGVSDADFMAGRRTFEGNGASAAVSNAGAITVGRGGYAALLGGSVSNAGTIVVPLGKVGLGAGERATLDFSGDGFLQVALPSAAGGTEALIRHSGTIKADGGRVIMSAATAREAARDAVNISGLVQARTIGGRSGAIVIGGGSGGRVTVSGRLDANSHKTIGGAVTVTGQAIALKGAAIDVSGKTGGGTVNIGGGRQGTGPLQHADTLDVDATTVIRADATSTGSGGNVVLWSDLYTTFAGTIFARGGAQGGNGGEAEVSGKAKLAYTGIADLSAAYGAFGTLLLDPFNVTISDGTGTVTNTSNSFIATAVDSIINAATLQTALETADVTVTTGGSSGSQAGNITVAAPLTWSTATTLNLTAAGAVTINAPITITGAGGLNITATAQAGITTTGLTFGNGASVIYAGGGTILGQSFTLNSKPYTLVYTMAQLDAIDKINAVDGTTLTVYGTGLAGNYALATNLSGTTNGVTTTYKRALIGTNSSGTDATRFTGRFDGLGHTVSDLTISAVNTDYVGLFGVTSNNSTISNIGVLSTGITGRTHVGAIVGANNSGVVQTSFSGGGVTGTANTGGLVGSNGGIVQASVAYGSVTGKGDRTGGLVGFNNGGTVATSYATGAVTGTTNVGGLVGQNNGGALITSSYATGAVSGTGNTGGLVGSNSVSSTIEMSYATGAVTSSADSTGGLVGSNDDGSWTFTSYWDTLTSGRTASIGDDNNGQTDNIVGLTTAQLQSGAADLLGDAFSGGAAGLYPYLTSFFPNGVQAISGFAYKDMGVTPLAPGLGVTRVTVFGDGVGFSRAVTTGANGYYYSLAPAGTLAAGDSILAFTQFNAGTGSTNAATVGTWAGNTAQTGVNIFGNTATGLTSATRLSDAPTLAQVKAAATAAAGSNTNALNAVAGTSGFGLISSGASFTIDQPVTTAATFVAQTTATDAPIIVSQPITITGSGSLGLFATGALSIERMVNVTGAGSVALAATEQSGITSTGLIFRNGASIDYGADQGGSFNLNGEAYTLVYTMAQLDAIDGINAVDGTEGGATYGEGLAGRYAMATDLTATSTGTGTGTVTKYGRALIGSGDYFYGKLDGLGHTLTGLTIDAPDVDNVGLIGLFGNATVSNVNLVGGSVAGNKFVGALVGLNNSGVGIIQTSSAYTTVSGTNGVGGLVGRNSGTVQASSASGTVFGKNRIGGLVGYNYSGVLQTSYATGQVTGDMNTGGLAGQNGAGGVIRTSYATGAVTGDDWTGGLVGVNFNASHIETSYATGEVFSSSALSGGFVGENDGSTISTSYWDTLTSGRTSGLGGDNNGQSANVIGLTTANLQGALPSALSPTVWGTGSGLYPYLRWQFAAGTTPQSVTGFAYQSDGTALSGAVVAGTVDGTALSRGGVSTGANGYYYFVTPQDTITSGSGVFTAVAGNTVKANSYRQGATGSVQDLNLYDGALTVTTDATTLSSVATGLAGSVGAIASDDLVFTTPGGVLTLNASTRLSITAAGDFSIDQGLLVPNDVLIKSAGSLGVAASGSVSSTDGDVTLVAGTTFVNERGADAVSSFNGRWLIYSADPRDDTRGGLAYDFKQYGATYGGVTAVAQSTGNGVLYGYAPTVTAELTGISKTYDGNTSATVGPSNLGATGIDGDTLALSYVSAGYDNANAGTGKTVTVDGLAITSATNGGATVYGYTLGSTTVSSAAGTITARPITVTADAQSRDYGVINPTLTYTVGAMGLVSSEALTGSLATDATLTSAAGSYAITEGTLSNGLNSNYAITYQGANLVVVALAPSLPAPTVSPLIVGSPDVSQPKQTTIGLDLDRSNTAYIAPLTIASGPVTSGPAASGTGQTAQTDARPDGDNVVTGSIAPKEFKSADGFVYKPLSQYDAAQYSGSRLPGYESKTGEAAVLTMLLRGALGSGDTPKIDNLFDPGQGLRWQGVHWSNALAGKVSFSDGGGRTATAGESFPIQKSTTDLAALLRKGAVILAGSATAPNAASYALLAIAMTDQGVVANDPGTGRQVLLAYDPQTKTLGGITSVFDAKAGTWTKLADVKPTDGGLNQAQLDGLATLSVDRFAAVSVQH